MTDYEMIINKLKTMDDEQLKELFNDINDVKLIAKLGYIALSYLTKEIKNG